MLNIWHTFYRFINKIMLFSSAVPPAPKHIVSTPEMMSMGFVDMQHHVIYHQLSRSPNPISPILSIPTSMPFCTMSSITPVRVGTNSPMMAGTSIIPARIGTSSPMMTSTSSPMMAGTSAGIHPTDMDIYRREYGIHDPFSDLGIQDSTTLDTCDPNENLNERLISKNDQGVPLMCLDSEVRDNYLASKFDRQWIMADSSNATITIPKTGSLPRRVCIMHVLILQCVIVKYKKNSHPIGNNLNGKKLGTSYCPMFLPYPAAKVLECLLHPEINLLPISPFHHGF